MGNRISISFENQGIRSVAIFSHWDGTDFLFMVKDFLEWLKHDVKAPENTPLGRMDPSIVALLFSYWVVKQNGVIPSSGYYLGKDQNDGDNSDNGHYIVDLNAFNKMEI